MIPPLRKKKDQTYERSTRITLPTVPSISRLQHMRQSPRREKQRHHHTELLQNRAAGEEAGSSALRTKRWPSKKSAASDERTDAEEEAPRGAQKSLPHRTEEEH